MRETKSLHEIFKVGERFQRSVNLASDYGNLQSLDDYIITSLSVSVLSRIGLGLKVNSKGRAWSITGPYGAGKSATILFIAEILGYPVNKRARKLLESEYPELLEKLYTNLPGLRDSGYIIIPVMGNREPISWTLLASLVERLSAQEISNSELRKHVNEVHDLYNRIRSGETVPPKSITEAIQRSAQIVLSSDQSALGILIFYDELGRALEYAALHPEHSDIGILQSIAELATRSGDAPVGLVTILHQAFEHYASTLSLVQQREWSKIQGRFEDIGFFESPIELLRLVDKAICQTKPAIEWGRITIAEVEKGECLGILPRDRKDHQEVIQVLAGCAPLHPTVTLVLGKLFRSRLSQNERSLFAFLSSREPYGLQEYLSQETWYNNGHCSFYRIDNLYDYIVTSMESVLYTQVQGKQWAEIEDALDRLPKEASDLEVQLIKAIGLFSLLGDQRYLKASKEILAYALTNGHSINNKDVNQALKRLADWDIIIYRRFKEAFGLWQGSDVDLNECFERGLAHLDRSQRLVSLLQNWGQLKPYVAKRHLHQTGTLRYFALWVIEFEDLEKIGDRSLGTADGAVVFILGTNGVPTDKILTGVKQFSADLESPRRELIFFAVPRGFEGIRDAFEETLAWDWVAENTPELEGDSIARRELSARRLAAQERLGRATARCFETTSAYDASKWVWKGKEQTFNTARSLTSVFSKACDKAYSSAPIVQNELINRRNISSAASAARRNLVERMLTHATETRLGIEGHPPEASIYLSVLKSSGLHHQEEETWMFGPPEGKDPCHVAPLWQAIDDFLTTTEKRPRSVTELYEILRQPPFGIKDGLLPIYAVVALLHWKAELALYEEGSFVPEVRPAECERLMRVPERFSLQRYRLDESRKRMLYEYSVLFGEELDPGDVTQLTAVQPVLAFANQLPRYAQLTNSLSEGAIAVRDALFSAREPQRLLFKTIPQALGFEMAGKSVEEVEQYFSHLKRVLVELQRAYEQLLLNIRRQLLDALLLPSDLEAARREIAPRVQILENWVADLRLKAFVSRLGDANLPQREWLESVAACLTNKPPSKWNDGDVLNYRVALADIAGQFRRTEEVTLVGESAEGNGNVGRVIRLGVTDALGHEQREIVCITSDQEHELEKAVNVLQETLQGFGADRAVRVMAVAELAKDIMRSMSLLEESDE